MDRDRGALLVAAAEAAEAGRAGRESAPARRWVERTLSSLASRGARLEGKDGIVLANAGAAVRFALDVAEASAGSEWRVAMAVHAGAGELRLRAWSLLAAAHGGQTVLTAEAATDAFDDLPKGATLRSLGPHLLPDLSPPREVYELGRPGEPVSFPPLRSLDVLKHNLPVQPAALVGQQDTIAEVGSLVSRQPVVTLTGPGGVGKTRVAVHAAASSAHNHPDGIVLIELADLSDPARLADHVTDALGIKPGRRIEDDLRLRHMLIVLDNCEHVLEGCADLAARVARSCPGVRLLVTSREPLGVRGEAVVSIRPLRSDAADDEAVRLFAERAALATQDFALTDENSDAVVEICRRLDGVPLAIELAAPHVRRLSPRQVADQLDDRFRLLSSGPRDADPRHRTLRDLVDWSYHLLDERQRTVFARLSVFVGGFDLDAARAVCPSEELSADDVAGAVQRLVDCSLVTVSASEPKARYGMLETLREYAAECLGPGGDTRARHLAWAADLVERAEAQMWGEHRPEWFAQLEAEQANVEAALRWALDSGRGTEAVEMAALFAHYWGTKGHMREGRAWLEEALASENDAHPHRAAQAMRIAGWLAFTQGDLASGRDHYAESLRVSDHPFGVVTGRIGLAEVERSLGHADETRRLVEESVPVARASGNLVLLHIALGALASLVSDEGDKARARALYEEALDAARRRGDRLATANLLRGMAGAAEGEEARRLLKEACALHREVGNRPGLADSLCKLAQLAHGDGDSVVMRKAAGEALSIARELELVDIEARCVELLGPPPDADSSRRRTLRREGTSWTISDGEGTFYLKHAKGLAYLSALLAKPGVEIHCLQLVGARAQDEETMQALEDLREQLREAEKWGDADRAGRLREEIGSMGSRLADEEYAGAERARQSVSKAIRDSIGRIAKYSPALAHDLSIRVRTGLYCCYLAGPGDDVLWGL